MEYLVDTWDLKEEEAMDLDNNLGLLLRRDQVSWLYQLISSIPLNMAENSAHFCITCCRYLMSDELVASHRHFKQTSTRIPHHMFPLILVQSKDTGIGGGDSYVSIQALGELQVSIGDVISHVLPHPHPRLVRVNGVGNNNLARCLYVHPQHARAEIWQGAMLSGKCAYRHCERVFNNRQSHLRLYGITPQFCSISCKIRTWLSFND